MISRQIGTLPHLPCDCGKPSRMMEVHVGGGSKRYRVEAICCQMVTVQLRTQEAAAYEFGRLRAVLAQERMVQSAMLTYPTRGNISQIRGMGQ